MGIIFISNQYIVGKESRAITLLDWNVTYSDLPNKKIMQYSFKLDILLGNKNVETIHNDKFYESYNLALSHLDLHKDEALSFLSTYKFATKQSELFYYARINNFLSHQTIHSIDRNNRIYHYLTNCPRILIPYFNIRYEMDISNSHPLLFSYFLINNLFNSINITINSNLKYDLLFNLSLINIDRNITNNIRYEGKLLRKSLKDRGISVPKAKELPNDILAYIYNTSRGYFWDNFQDLWDGMERSEVKLNLFREIFYSHSTTVKNKQYGKEFVKQYPNVWKIIRKLKKEHARSYLPNVMMRFESKLFREILSKCYEKKWCVINIHDAVVVLDSPENDTCTQEGIRLVIKEVYGKYNLYPTVKTEMNEICKQ